MLVRVCLAAPIALAISAVGCDEQDSAATAIADANRTLRAMAIASPSPTGESSVSSKTQQYKSIISSLRSVTSDARPRQTSTAWLLIHEAQMGLAEFHAADAADLEGEALRRITVIRSALAGWTSDNAIADARAEYSAAAEIEQIDKKVAQRQAQIAAVRARQEEVAAQVADLRNRAAEISGRAGKERVAIGELRRQAIGMSAVDATPLIEEAVRRGREADALDVQASRLQAEANKIAPQIDELKGEVARLTSQQNLLGEAREQAKRREAMAKQEAADAREHAALAETDLSQLIAQLRDLRAGTLAKATEEALSGFEEAAGSARRAEAVARTRAKIAGGSANQSLGDVSWMRAQGLAAYASILEAVAGASPPPSEADAYSAEADQARQIQAEALAKATEAYEAAARAFDSAGVRGEGRDKLQRAIERIAQAAYTTSGGETDLRAEFASRAPEPEPEDMTTAAPTASGPAATIDAVLGLIQQRDFVGIMDYVSFDDPNVESLFRDEMVAAEAAFAFNDACTEKFGSGIMEAYSAGKINLQGLTTALSPTSQQVVAPIIMMATMQMNQGGDMGGGMGGGMGQFGDLANLSSADFRFETIGDTAQMYLPASFGPGAAKPMPMHLDGDRWLIDLSTAGSGAALTSEMMAFGGRMIGSINQALTQVTSGVRSGQYADHQAALFALVQQLAPTIDEAVTKMMEQMQNQMGGQMPGKPGGRPGG
jgi:hypothetical protein